MTNCKHTFEAHVGVKVFGGRAYAWVPMRYVTTPLGRPFKPDKLRAAGHQVLITWRCTKCGEQGYEVPER